VCPGFVLRNGRTVIPEAFNNNEKQIQCYFGGRPLYWKKSSMKILMFKVCQS